MSSLTSVYEASKTWAEQKGLELYAENEVASTNDWARSEATLVQAAVKVYFTNHQTKGRGRGTHTWTDTSSGECFLSSWSLELPSAAQPISGPCMGLALFRAVSKIWPGREWSIKAPNDLYLDGKKLGGILIETVSSGSLHRMIVGIGLNVLNHPRAIENSTHLDSEVDEADWYNFLNELLAQLQGAAVACQQHHLSEAQQQELLNALNANSSKTILATQITPYGDIVHTKGRIRWTEL